MLKRILTICVCLTSAVAYAAGEPAITITDKSATIENELLAISVDLTKGTYSGTDKSDGTVMFKNASFQLDRGTTSQWRQKPTDYFAEDMGSFTDKFGEGRKLRFWRKPAAPTYDPDCFLDITLYQGKPSVVLGWGVKNPFKYDLRVCRAELLFDGRMFQGQEPTQEKVLRGGAGAEPNQVESTWMIDALNSAMLTYIDANSKSRRTIVAGGLQYAEFLRQVAFQQGINKFDNAGSYEYERPMPNYKGDQKQMTCTAWDPQGKRIAAGTLWESKDSVYLDFVTKDPFISLEQYGDALAAANNANPNKYDFVTLCGWAVGHLGEGTGLNHSAGLVNQMDAARDCGLTAYTQVALRLEPDFYCYSNQGDTQQGWWDDEHWAKYGALRPPYETFKKFAGALKAQNGITFTYFQGSLPSNDFAVEHPEWMLWNDISRIHVDHAHHKPIIRYDYSDPEFQEYVLTMWKRLRSDGVQGIKFDYPETAWARYGGFEDKSYTTTSAYRKFFQLCREGLGENAYIHERNIGGRTHEATPRTDVTAGIVDLQRVWGDGSHYEPEMGSRIGLRWYKQGKVFRYYPDAKSVTQHGKVKTPLTQEERRTVITMVGLLSGRFELATSFGNITPEIRHDLTRIFPVLPNGKSFRPVDMLLGGEHPSVYVYDVTDDWKQVILVNNDNSQPKEMKVPLSGDQADTGSIGCQADKQYEIFDFWNQKYVGAFKAADTLTVDLQPSETRVYSVREKKDHPRIIGTSRHVMCGMFEISGEEWNAQSKELSFKANLMAVEPLNVTIAVPSGLQAADTKVDGGSATLSQADGVVNLKLMPIGQKNSEATVKLIFQ